VLVAGHILETSCVDWLIWVHTFRILTLWRRIDFFHLSF